MKLRLLAAAALLAACSEADPGQPPPEVSPAGLVPLTCGRSDPLFPVHRSYCWRGVHYMTPAARKSLEAAAAKVAKAYPGTQVAYMDASWAKGVAPMPPHLSHGDGRQIDLALFYEDLDGKPLKGPPTMSGYGAFEPPRREADRIDCGSGPHEKPDPAKNRRWRLDEARTKVLLRALIDDPKVRKILLEPHLKTRLGFAGEAKVRFAGCKAARHDDHIHVDFH